MKLTLQAGGETRTVRVLRRGEWLRVSYEDGREVELRLLSSGDGGFELENGHARIHGAGARNSGTRQLWVNGRTLTYERERGAAQGRDAAAETRLAASIPSVVLEVLVAPGDAVVEGEKLVLLESMKMVVPIQANCAGIVKTVLCAPGEAVAPGQPLVELDGSSPGT